MAERPMRDPRVEPRAGDEFRFEDGEVVKVTSANKQWVKFASSELGARNCRAGRFRQILSMHGPAVIHVAEDSDNG